MGACDSFILGISLSTFSGSLLEWHGPCFECIISCWASESLSRDFGFILPVNSNLCYGWRQVNVWLLKIAKTARGGSGLKLSILNPEPGTHCSSIFGMWSEHLFFPHSQIGGGGGKSSGYSGNIFMLFLLKVKPVPAAMAVSGISVELFILCPYPKHTIYARRDAIYAFEGWLWSGLLYYFTKSFRKYGVFLKMPI